MGLKAKVAAAFGLHMAAWLAMFLVLAGLLFCAAGIYLAIAAALGPMPAAFITGGCLIGVVVIAGLLCLLLAKTRKRRRKNRVQQHNPDDFLEEQVRGVIGAPAARWTRENTGLAVIGALSAGVLLAASPQLRAIIMGATRPLITRKTAQIMQRFFDLD